jgi:hypothetical protein
MYSVDERDKAIEIHDLPQPDVGAPEPIVVADEHRVLLAYRLSEQSERDFGDPERWAIIEIKGCWAHFFGPPNDEALHGHPLYARGLTPYGVFKVRDSSWIRLMERRNRVHDRHDSSRYAKLSHLIFTFHDSTFECVAESLKSVVKSWDENFEANLARGLHG